VAAGQRWFGREAPDGGDVDDVGRYVEARGTGTCGIQLAPVALTVVEGYKAREGLLTGNLVRERDGVESAGTDDVSFHQGSLF
jgi:hypothetical protein